MSECRKGETRQAVNRVLAKAEMPLTRDEICERSGRPADEVRIALCAMVTNGEAYTDGHRRPARYTALPPEEIKRSKPAAATSRTYDYTTAPNYVPVELRPFTARAGANDASLVPSLYGNRRVYR